MKFEFMYQVWGTVEVRDGMMTEQARKLVEQAIEIKVGVFHDRPEVKILDEDVDLRQFSEKV
jgi:hypothetical protein